MIPKNNIALSKNGGFPTLTNLWRGKTVSIDGGKNSECTLRELQRYMNGTLRRQVLAECYVHSTKTPQRSSIYKILEVGGFTVCTHIFADFRIISLLSLNFCSK